MEKESRITIEVPVAHLDFSSDDWKDVIKRDFQEIQQTLESKPNLTSPAYYTWFWFFMKYSRTLNSKVCQDYMKRKGKSNLFELVRDALGLTMSGGGAYTIGLKFFDDFLKDSPEKEFNGISFRLKESYSPSCSPVQQADSPYRPYITAIKSKPFLLLAGISGTGKSRIVRELARACWDVDSPEYKAQKPRNFEMVQVKPNWHDSSELIGYVSRIDGVRYVVGPFLRFMVKAINDPDTPYFLCLDEMNLAPVEQYFAEYLSVVESRKRQDDGTILTDPIVDYSNTEEYFSLISQLFTDDNERKAYLQEEGGKRLCVPQNLIVVGTVNMDETTFSFSRKVLDRAMTIEMNEVDLNGGLTERHEQIGKLGHEELIGTAVEGVDIYASNKAVCDTAIQYLQKVNDQLEGTPFKVAYRTRNEVLLYVVNNLPYNKDKDGKDLEQGFIIARALDEITNMKVLSRIEGDETKVSAAFLDGLKRAISEGLESIYEGTSEKSISLAKLEEMKKRLSSGYTSFWN